MIPPASSPAPTPDPAEGTPSPSNARDVVETLLKEARLFFSQRNPRKAADALHLAHTTAAHNNMHREAATLRRALAILSSGGKPKLLTRPTAKLTEDQEEK